MHPDTRTTLRTVPSVPATKGLNERQAGIFDKTIKIVSYLIDDCTIETKQTPRPKKTEQKTMLVIGPLEITMQTTVYYPSEVTHHELKIVYAQRIRFQLVHDGGDKTHATEALVDQSADIEMLLKKVLHNQETAISHKTRS